MALTTNFTDALLPLVEQLSAETDFSKLLFQKTFLPSEFNPAHTIVTGVRNGNVVPIIQNSPNYEAFPFVDANSCEIPECTQSHNYSGRKWELGLIECRTSICLRSFEDEFLIFWNQYKMVNLTGDETEGAIREHLDTALLQFIVDNVKRDLNAAKWRVAWFGDKASNSKYLNGIDGFFTQMEALPANTAEIAKNAEATYAAQQMTGEEVLNTVDEMNILREDLLWGDAPEVIRMTKLAAQKLAGYLNRLDMDRCCGMGFSIDPAKVGATRSFRYDNLNYHEIPIEVVPEWDAIINGVSELNGGGGNNARVNPNRIVWGAKENFLIGTQNREELDMFDIFYDKRDRKVYIDAGAYLGAAIPTSEFILAQ